MSGRLVDVRREMPLPWQQFLAPLGIDSLRGLSRRTGVSPETIRRLFWAEVSDATVRKVADALRVKPARIYELRGETPVIPFELPEAASRLTEKQRGAVLSVIYAMLDPGAAAGDDLALRRVARKRRPPDVGPRT